MKHGFPLLVSGFAIALLIGACMEPSAPADGGDAGPTLATAAITVPTSFSDVQIAGGLSGPTAMAFAPDGRIFVTEKPGRVRIIKNGALLSTSFVTLSVSSSGERGVLGIAIDPAFASNKYVYVYYTSTASGIHNRVSRFTANGDVSSAEKVLLDLPTLSSATNHNGGALHFGDDGKLYISVGENANGANAQNLGTTLGKMLRINADGTIPTDNPFYASGSGINRAIWAYGLRNPFTFAFQPGTGRMFINDVGQNNWEEIDDGVKGANYGWPTTEGSTSNPSFKTPFFSYDHGQGCAITGGAFYNPATSNFPSQYTGDYFYADYCGNWIKSIDLATKTVTSFATGLGSPTDIRVGSDGSLYYVAYASGSVRRISYSGQAPVISQQPANRTVAAGTPAAFTVAASGAAPLAYRWQRNQADIAGATAATYTLANAQAADNGARFRCIVSNAAGNATSSEAVLTVVADQAPTAHITAPIANSSFRGGQAISFSGTGTDPEQGNLPASAFTWEVRLWHDDGNLHNHPFYGPVSGAMSGSVTIPDQGETSPNVWYRFRLTVKDAQGLIHSDSLDILPIKATVTLASNPAGLQLKLDGVPVTAPFTFTGVAGMKRVIEAVTPQTAGGKSWQFQSWSDAGAASHTLVFPSAGATYTAAFQEVTGPQTYEAENAALSGAIKATDHAGYVGTGFADYVNASNDYVEWTVSAAAAGAKALDFRYALAAAAGRPLRITVNGAVVNASAAFAPTGSWDVWKLVTVNASLNAGSNTVRATAIGSSGPNLDNLTVR